MSASRVEGQENQGRLGGTGEIKGSYPMRQFAVEERLAELEMENARLHRLVAELLLKNQQLRKVD